MTKLTAVAILVIAAAFEAGGDTLMRLGLKEHSGTARWLFLAAGAITLALYGLVVNVPDWDFGKLLGLYVVFFFVIAQLLSWLVFNQPPSTMTLAGGSLILAGGVVLAIANA